MSPELRKPIETDTVLPITEQPLVDSAVDVLPRGSMMQPSAVNERPTGLVSRNDAPNELPMILARLASKSAVTGHHRKNEADEGRYGTHPAQGRASVPARSRGRYDETDQPPQTGAGGGGNSGGNKPPRGGGGHRWHEGGEEPEEPNEGNDEQRNQPEQVPPHIAEERTQDIRVSPVGEMLDNLADKIQELPTEQRTTRDLHPYAPRSTYAEAPNEPPVPTETPLPAPGEQRRIIRPHESNVTVSDNLELPFLATSEQIAMAQVPPVSERGGDQLWRVSLKTALTDTHENPENMMATAERYYRGLIVTLENRAARERAAEIPARPQGFHEPTAAEAAQAGEEAQRIIDIQAGVQTAEAEIARGAVQTNAEMYRQDVLREQEQTAAAPEVAQQLPASGATGYKYTGAEYPEDLLERVLGGLRGLQTGQANPEARNQANVDLSGSRAEALARNGLTEADVAAAGGDILQAALNKIAQQYRGDQ